MNGLSEYGWNDRLEDALRESGPDLEPARVVAEHRDLYRVQCLSGEAQARIAGRLRHAAHERSALPVVGDWVAIARASSEGDRLIRHVLPRFSHFSRKVAGESAREQVLAANVDFVWLVSGLDRALSPRALERYVIAAWESRARPVVVLTKADLAEDRQAAARHAEQVAPGVPVHVVSSLTGEGLDALETYLEPGRTGALLGPSGAGKSTLINRLAGEELLQVSSVRERDGKGRHTTTHRQLIRLEGGGLIIDTPGLRELGLWDIEAGLPQTFSDIEALAAGCRFSDCRHAGEPGCRVAAAVDEGELDPSRVESYHKLQREHAYLERRHDARARAEEERRIRIVMKSLKDHPKYRKDR